MSTISKTVPVEQVHLICFHFDNQNPWQTSHLLYMHSLKYILYKTPQEIHWAHPLIPQFICIHHVVLFPTSWQDARTHDDITTFFGESTSYLKINYGQPDWQMSWSTPDFISPSVLDPWYLQHVVSTGSSRKETTICQPGVPISCGYDISIRVSGCE